MKIMNLRLETGYLVEPIALPGGASIHHIQIVSTGKDGSPQVRLTLDPNRCTVDSFGEPKACTRMAPLHIDAELSVVEECDGKQLLAVKFKGKGPALRLALLPLCVGGKEATVARLLVYGENGEITAILPLQGSSAGCVVA